MITRRCPNGTAPQYLAAHCVPVSATASRQHLRSVASHQLVVPSYRLSSNGRRAFSVAGQTTWNSLPKQLRDPVHTTSVFARLLKTFLRQRIRGCFYRRWTPLMRYTNWRFTYLLTDFTEISPSYAAEPVNCIHSSLLRLPFAVRPYLQRWSSGEEMQCSLRLVCQHSGPARWVRKMERDTELNVTTVHSRRRPAGLSTLQVPPRDGQRYSIINDSTGYMSMTRRINVDRTKNCMRFTGWPKKLCHFWATLYGLLTVYEAVARFKNNILKFCPKVIVRYLVNQTSGSLTKKLTALELYMLNVQQFSTVMI